MFSLLRIKNCIAYKLFNLLIAIFFFSSMCVFPSNAHAQSMVNLPAPGTMIAPSVGYTPAIVAGITIYPDNPLQFDFIIDTGDDNLQGEELRQESKKLINYFLATLTVPEDEMWVNLSPYEKDRIVANGLGVTEMGRDMLAQDYMLKQLTASLMYPEEEIGEVFWNKIYEKTQARFGTTDIPTNTFNKVWIVPEKAIVYVNGKNVFVSESHLKVMLEEDYLALESNLDSEKHGLGDMTKNDIEKLSEEAKEVIREVIIPEIEKEVNQGKNFANLRQIYNSMILAAWYKKNLRESILGSVYMDLNKITGIDLEDKQVKDKIYKQYVEAFQKGVYDYIKEDYDPVTQEVIPRKYFSGGLEGVEGEAVGERTDRISSAAESRQRERYEAGHPLQREGVRLDMTDGGGDVITPEKKGDADGAMLARKYFTGNGVLFEGRVESRPSAEGEEYFFTFAYAAPGNLAAAPSSGVKVDQFSLGTDLDVARNVLFSMTDGTAWSLNLRSNDGEEQEFMAARIAQARTDLDDGITHTPYGDSLVAFESLIDQELADGDIAPSRQGSFISALSSLSGIMTDETSFRDVVRALKTVVLERLRGEQYPEVFWGTTVPALAAVVRDANDVVSLGERAIREGNWRMGADNLRFAVQQERAGRPAPKPTSQMTEDEVLASVVEAFPAFRDVRSLVGKKVDFEYDQVFGSKERSRPFGHYVETAQIRGITLKGGTAGFDDDSVSLEIDIGTDRPIRFSAIRRQGVFEILGNQFPTQIEVIEDSRTAAKFKDSPEHSDSFRGYFSAQSSDRLRALKKAAQVALARLDALEGSTRLANATMYYSFIGQGQEVGNARRTIVEEYLTAAGVEDARGVLLSANDGTLDSITQRGASTDNFVQGIRNFLTNVDNSISDNAMLTHGGIDLNPSILNLQQRGHAVDFKIDNTVFQNIQSNSVNGIVPVIINITPVINYVPLLGLSDDKEELKLSQLQ